MASTFHDSGQTTGSGKDAKKVPGSSGTAHASSQLVCPEAGCTGKVTGNVKAVAGPEGQRSTSTADGSTGVESFPT